MIGRWDFQYKDGTRFKEGGGKMCAQHNVKSDAVRVWGYVWCFYINPLISNRGGEILCEFREQPGTLACMVNLEGDQ